MDPLGPSGEFILDYSVKDALAAGLERIIFVIRRDLEKDFRDIVGKHWEDKADVQYAMQDLTDIPEGFEVPADRKKPWGTAHAVLAARHLVNGSFAVVNADDFYGAEAFKLCGDYLAKTEDQPSRFCMVAYRLDKTLSKFGSVSRGVCSVDATGMLLSIKERLELKRCEDGIIRDGEDVFADDTLVSMNMFGFKLAFIDLLLAEFPLFLKDGIANPKSEFQMPTALGKFLHRGDSQVAVMQTQSDWFGITSREDRAEVMAHLRDLK